MPPENLPLENLRIASPCHEDWDAMTGDARSRFCHQCQLNVYNLSEMSRKEAEALIAQKEGKLCVRYYRREDGTILTQNCPVGLRAVRRRVLRVASVITAAVISFFTTIGVYAASNSDKDNPAPPVCNPKQVPDRAIMGDIAYPPPPPISGPPVEDPAPIMGKPVIEPPPEGTYPPEDKTPQPIMGNMMYAPSSQPTDSIEAK